jgi:hypothetical protein
MKNLLFIIALLYSAASFGQRSGSYIVVRCDTTDKQKFGYVFVNQRGDTITRLDTTKYYICFSDTIQYFAIVGIRNKPGWWAIDKNEKPLFQVLNTSSGEPSPDELREGMIRIVDDSGKIGFADCKGAESLNRSLKRHQVFIRESQSSAGNVNKCSGAVKARTKTNTISWSANRLDI